MCSSRSSSATSISRSTTPPEGKELVSLPLRLQPRRDRRRRRRTPRALGIKEEVILAELLDFMGKRIFGPDRLRLLRVELAKSASGDWQEHDEELKKLDGKREQIERSIYRQTLRLEEYEDPNHPVIAAAKQRIEELTIRHAAVQNATARLKARRPAGVRPEEIIEMLDAIPDLRQALAAADPAELADICDAFQITAVYDKANRTVELSATITPELLPKDKTPTDEDDPVGGFVYIARANQGSLGPS